MTTFLLSPARHAAEIRRQFPGENVSQLCGRVGFDIGDSPAEDRPHLFAVIDALCASDDAFFASEQAA